MRRYAVKLDERLAARLDERCAGTGQSPSEIVESLISGWLDSHPNIADILHPRAQRA
jgi:metal-responsive CopG/Arc/MetJ family transcriptional regulator